MAGETSPVVEAARLDELMLAMDVVDTLRHESDLVQRELAGEARAAALVARLRDIYAGQGIEVPDHVLREGVAALEQDRFVHARAPRTFAVRLAELYVTRGRWGPFVAVAAAVVVGAWIAIGIALTHQERSRVEGLARRFADAAHGIAVSKDALAQVDIREEHRRSSLSSYVASAAEPDWARFRVERAEAAEALKVAEERLASVRSLPEPRPAADVLALEQVAALATREVDQALRALTPLDELFRTGERARGLLEALGGLPTTPDAEAAVVSARDALSRAIAAADQRAVTERLDELVALREVLEKEYVLRIVSRSGVDTGFWREPDGGGALDYYIVLEAVDAGGDVLPLAVVDEESQRRATVQLFAQRVPAAVFERVRDDKRDNGLVDDAVVGAKRRGALTETFTIETAGGRLTRW